MDKHFDFSLILQSLRIKPHIQHRSVRQPFMVKLRHGFHRHSNFAVRSSAERRSTLRCHGSEGSGVCRSGDLRSRGGPPIIRHSNFAVRSSAERRSTLRCHGLEGSFKCRSGERRSTLRCHGSESVTYVLSLKCYLCPEHAPRSFDIRTSPFAVPLSGVPHCAVTGQKAASGVRLKKKAAAQ